MLIDKLLQISDAEAVTVTAASANSIDLGAAGDALGGQELYCDIRVATTCTAAGAATVAFDLQHDSVSNFASATSLISVPAVAKATLVAGYWVLRAKIPTGCKRYLRVNFTVATGPLTAGNFDVIFSHAVDIRQP